MRASASEPPSRVADQRDVVADHHALAAQLPSSHRRDDPFGGLAASDAGGDEDRVPAAVHPSDETGHRVLVHRSGLGATP
jgi:hypothetical protein